MVSGLTFCHYYVNIALFSVVFTFYYCFEAILTFECFPPDLILFNIKDIISTFWSYFVFNAIGSLP